MKLHIKKLYKETVHQLEKHKTEIEIALALAAVAALEEDNETIEAKEDIQSIYVSLIGDYQYHINEITNLLEDDL